ncbi:MAG: PUA domain-containing protein, partial [Acidimicrobiales bacterium]
IAAAERPGVLAQALSDAPGVGTTVRPRPRRLAARKLWIAFAVASSGRVVVDDGARRALVARHSSLLPAGVVAVEGEFSAEDAVEIVDLRGSVVAKGLARHDAALLGAFAGRHSSELPPDRDHEAVHRDDMVVLVDPQRGDGPEAGEPEAGAREAGARDGEERGGGVPCPTP